jgi:hypothetical protein
MPSPRFEVKNLRLSGRFEPGLGGVMPAGFSARDDYPGWTKWLDGGRMITILDDKLFISGYRTDDVESAMEDAVSVCSDIGVVVDVKVDSLLVVSENNIYTTEFDTTRALNQPCYSATFKGYRLPLRFGGSVLVKPGGKWVFTDCRSIDRVKAAIDETTVIVAGLIGD